MISTGQDRGADVLSIICKLLSIGPPSHNSTIPPLSVSLLERVEMGYRLQEKYIRHSRDPPKAPPLKPIKNLLAKSQTKPKKLSQSTCLVLFKHTKQNSLVSKGLLRSVCVHRRKCKQGVIFLLLVFAIITRVNILERTAFLLSSEAESPLLCVAGRMQSHLLSQ